ncbi:MAG: signal peptidase I [Pseudomonadota bacterium]|nr:signal peptidase I [Pseudomonadota bacterium]
MDFSAALLVATVVTGVVLAVEHLVFRRDRQPMFLDSVMHDGAPPPIPNLEPAWLDLGRSFFGVIFVVFFVRSFVVEPFKIPSGSMIPTLRIGDFILVNKYAYGLRMPITNKPVVEVGSPQRGDVMVFRYPRDPSTNFIKRVIGLPGDVIAYSHKQLSINGQPVALTPAPQPTAQQRMEFPNMEWEREQLGEHLHTIQLNPNHPSLELGQVTEFPNREACRYNSEGVTCTVPPGNYFMMGDNRDSSFDSRYWGFVPDRNIVGRAFVVWLNFGELARIGRSIP